MKKEAEGSMGGPRRQRLRVDHTWLRLTSSRREEGVSDVASRAHISLRPLLYFLPFSVLPCTFSRLPSRLPRSFLSSILSLLSLSLPLHPFHSLASCPLSPSFVASVVPRASLLLSDTLHAALCDYLPRSPASLFCPRRAFRPRAGRADCARG